MNISVIICTHNGVNRIENALHSLSDMIIPESVLWELVIVDNGSTDNTKEIVTKTCDILRLPYKYVLEKYRGLSFARNRGILASSGEIIAFTDDDCIVTPNWISSILKEFHLNGDLALIGGKVELYNKKDQPVTIRIGNKRKSFSDLSHIFSLLPGCNMAMKNSIFETVGAFDTYFGAGASIPSAEDSDFFYRAFKAGLKLVYCPDILIYHNHGRRTLYQVKMLNTGYTIGQGAFYCKHILMGDKKILVVSGRRLYSVIRSIIINLSSLTIVSNKAQIIWNLSIGFYRYLKLKLHSLFYSHKSIIKSK